MNVDVLSQIRGPQRAGGGRSFFFGAPKITNTRSDVIPCPSAVTPSQTRPSFSGARTTERTAERTTTGARRSRTILATAAAATAGRRPCQWRFARRGTACRDTYAGATSTNDVVGGAVVSSAAGGRRCDDDEQQQRRWRRRGEEAPYFVHRIIIRRTSDDGIAIPKRARRRRSSGRSCARWRGIRAARLTSRRRCGRRISFGPTGGCRRTLGRCWTGWTRGPSCAMRSGRKWMSKEGGEGMGLCPAAVPRSRPMCSNFNCSSWR